MIDSGFWNIGVTEPKLYFCVEFLSKIFLKSGNLFVNGAAVSEMSPDWKDGTKKYEHVLR